MMRRLITDGQCDMSDARNAEMPCARPMSPKPAATMRELIELPAAIPTSAQGPHCTLDDAWPRTRRLTPNASRQLLAAA
eukprot:scaffold328343_cov97-Tisochrysis_lutea.AAC.1